MLAGLLLSAIVAAVLATIGLFVHLPGRFGGGAWLWTRRFVLALAGTMVLAVAGAAVVHLADHPLRTVETAFVVLVVASVAWLPLTRRWNARAHLCWSMNVVLFVLYLAFMLNWTLESPLGALGQVGAFLLLGLEAFAAVLTCAYLWELCDALGREHWTRRSDAGLEPGEDPGAAHPFVSLHVPSYEEPPDMVIETLRSLKGLDYDNYEIVAIDDNTRDESLWRPVQEWCAQNGVRFAHLQDWPGYKSGALNYALEHLTGERAEVVGVIDSDYQIEPDFLRRCAPLFNDPAVGFVQSPQDYREWDRTPFFRRLYYSYKYFFAVSQPSRNERDGAIFAGTMGLIRRQALVDLGGWDEWCITEDAELSLRLLRAGWSGLHVDASFGHGLMPLSFEALKGQRFRWCFGGIQILRMHWRAMLPGGDPANRLTVGQRWAYLSGALQWYGDLVALVFYFFLLGGAVNIALGGGLLFRKLTPFLLAAIPALVLLGFVRAVALIRRGTGASWSDAIGAFFVWQSTSLVVARASVQALFARKAEFLRTPKTGADTHALDAVRGNKGETLLAVLGAAGIVAALLHADTISGPLLAGLLLLPTAAYASAPVNSLAAQRTTLPTVLEQRRRIELRRGRYVRRSAAALAGAGTIAGVAVVVLGLLVPGGRDVQPPRLGPAPDTAQPSTVPSLGPSGGTPEPAGPSGSVITPGGGPGSGSSGATPSASPSRSSTASSSASPSRSPSSSPSGSTGPTAPASGTSGAAGSQTPAPTPAPTPGSSPTAPATGG
jgi:cellulose synthase/poly-beta-1,6-N-acetylglucosamine synthase-like glycosyltransferase